MQAKKLVPIDAARLFVDLGVDCSDVFGEEHLCLRVLQLAMVPKNSSPAGGQLVAKYVGRRYSLYEQLALARDP